MTRRSLLKALGVFSAGALTGCWTPKQASAAGTAAAASDTPAKLSHEEWAKLLPADAYAVLFEENTERPGTSPLNHEKRDGTFVCAACYNPIFKSTMKYNSGTGWPSFFDVIPGAIGTKEDRSFFSLRTEYHCKHCGGHMGHVFDDGPPPTNLRYCNNGLALRFVPKEEALPALRA